MTSDTSTDSVPEAVIRKKKGIQTIWIVPIVAALVGGWLWYKAMQEQGPTIVLNFVTADGIEAGKTKIKFKELEVGHVTDIQLAPSLDHVIATAELTVGSEPYLVDGTRFWVVKPRIGAGGVSGLGTIISGAYIAADLSTQGQPTSTFQGLEDPPSRPADASGLMLKLRSDSMGSISAGTPVSHLQIPMGQVDGYTYLRDEELIEFDVYIEPEYADLVRTNTRFWNASGFDVTLSADGFDVHAESLEAILLGGIAFGKAPGEPLGPAAEAGQVYSLIATDSEAAEINSQPRQTISYFSEPLTGLSVGSAVVFQGIEIGKVLQLSVEVDRSDVSFRMPVLMETYPGRLSPENDDPDESHHDRVTRMVEGGLRAQLGPANLLTGARDIVVDFHPDTTPNYFASETDPPEIPTIISTGEAITEMISQLPTIVADLQSTVAGISEIVASSQTKDTLASVESAAASLDLLLTDLQTDSRPLVSSLSTAVEEMRTLVTRIDSVMQDLQGGTPNLIATLQETADSALGLVQEGEGGVANLAADLPIIQEELTAALREISSGMRSIAALADYLERHPESLLLGKDDS